MRRTDEGDHCSTSRCLIEENLGVARGDNLGALFERDMSQSLVNLALSENFEMRVRFIEEQYAPRVGIEMRKK
jgi:hypothetical protein